MSFNFNKMSAIGKTTVLFAAMFSTLVIVELFFQIYYRVFVGFEERGVFYNYIPHVEYAYMPGSEVQPGLYTDKHGFVHNGYDASRDLLEKSPDEFRIFILGGSTVAGSCVLEPRLTIASRLEESLKAIFEEAGINKKPKVINAGISAYFSGNELALFQQIILKMHPDYAIFFHGSNDFYNNPKRYAWNGVDVKGILDGNFTPMTKGFFDSVNNMFSYSGIVRQAIAITKNKSATMRFLIDVYIKLVSLKGKDAVFELDDDLKPVTERFAHNTRNAMALSYVWPIGQAHVIQPILYPSPNLVSSDAEKANKYIHSGMWDGGKFFQIRKEFFHKIEKIYEQLQAQNSNNSRITTLSLAWIFDLKKQDEALACDNVHYTPAGYSLINQELVKGLKDHILSQAAVSR